MNIKSKIILTNIRTDLEEIFGEVCPRITQLVQAQVDTLRKSDLKAKAIFLVGGFGANKYLKEELQKAFKGIEIQQPKDAYVETGGRSISDLTMNIAGVPYAEAPSSRV